IAQTIKPIHLTCASKRHECHALAVSGLETHRGPGRNVEVLTKRQATRKHQGLVDLEEMHMRSYLNGTITMIGHLNLDRLTAHVRLNRLRAQDIFPWNHRFIHPSAEARVPSLA